MHRVPPLHAPGFLMALVRALRAPVAGLAAGLISGLRATLHLSFVDIEKYEAVLGTPHILAFWHRHLLLMTYASRHPRTSALISSHGDGELISRAIGHLGYPSVRGSSTRGGAAAFKEMARELRDGGNLAITPDGPRGPACVAKPGVVQAAALADAPIVPISFAARKKKA